MVNSKFGFARGSLFDRLTDLEPAVPSKATSIKTLTVSEFKDSVLKEISWLLNTRCQIAHNDVDQDDRNFINYGIPDFSCFFPDSSENRTRLAKTIKDTIKAFEPRLKNIFVDIEDFANKEEKFTLKVKISAYLIIKKIKEPITFLMDLG